MKLWCLYPKPGEDVYTGYDDIYFFVVRATSEKEARELAAGEAAAEGSGVWRNEKKMECEILRVAGRPEVICSASTSGWEE